MGAYFEYLKEMIIAFFSDVGQFLYKAIVSPWVDVPNNFAKYGALFGSYVNDFGFLGWLFYVIFFIAFVGVIGAICFGIFILLRKYIRFAKKEIDKDALRKQVERLNYELYSATKEKDKILNLKTAYLGLKPTGDAADGSMDAETAAMAAAAGAGSVGGSSAIPGLGGRFPKL